MALDLVLENDYAERGCPSCGSAYAPLAAEVASATPAQTRPFNELQQYWYGFFDQKVFFSYARCTACGLLYAPTYFSIDQLTRLYSSMPANMAEATHGALAETQRGYFDEFKKHAKLRGTFLEIGPDTGLFAEHCAKEGSFSTFWMFEPNIATHEELRSRLGAAHVHISTALLDLSAVPDSSVDAVAMIHVVDHLLDPLPFLRELRPKLADNATVLIVTHDESSLLAKATRARWPAYCLQHPQLFNPTSMRRLLANADLDVVKTVRSVNHFPVHYLVEHGFLAFGLGKVKLPAIDWLRVPLRLGNFITIARPAKTA